jgi:hypothetical protein
MRPDGTGSRNDSETTTTQKNRTLVLALSGALLLGGAGSARALSGDQASACGAILCLADGAGVGQCAPYLARYFAITAPNPAELFERRLDFLNLCAPPGMPGDVRQLLARYGATCQPATLVSRLNAQIHACEAREADDPTTCQPTGNEWQVCASFYGHGYTAYDAPELHEMCARVRDTDGSLVERCDYAWTEAGAEAPELDPTRRGGVGHWPGFAPAGWGMRDN